MIKRAVVFSLYYLLVLSVFNVFAEDVPDISLPLKENKTFIIKKPTIVCRDAGINYKTIKVIMLDDVDITNIVKIKGESFVFKVFVPLASGEHKLSVVYGKESQQQKEYIFSTKQTRAFDVFKTKLSTTTVYKNTLEKSDSLTNIPHYSVESNPTLNTQIANQNWSSSFNMSTRYLEQSTSIEVPQKRGLDLAGYLFNAQYSKDEVSLLLNIGDIQIDESDYSAQGLASRGGQFQVGYKNYKLETFLMDSKQRYGFKDGMGLDAGSTNSIYGMSLENLFFDRVKIKAIYLHSSKNGDGFGTSSIEGSTNATEEGKVYGLVVSAPILDEKINMYSEIDFSSYDSNNNDAFGSKKDKAYKVKLDGMFFEKYNYSLMYEYVGTDYYSIGNEGLTNNKKGLSLTTSANYTYHTFNLSASRYRDNLENDDTIPTIYTTHMDIAYSLSRFENFPFNLAVSRDIEKSRDEPSKDEKRYLVTDTYHGDVGYTKDVWSIIFSADYSFANDKTYFNQDTKTLTYTLSPSYSSDNFHMEYNISFNRSVDIQTEVAARTYTSSLSFGGNFFSNALSYDCAATYTKSKSSDGSSNERDLGSTFQVAYTWNTPSNFILLKKPSVGIQGAYNHRRDKVNGSSGHDFNVVLFVEVPLEYIF